jgi:hypothetical protein
MQSILKIVLYQNSINIKLLRPLYFVYLLLLLVFIGDAKSTHQVIDTT